MVKIPKMLLKPPQGWTETYGMQRSCKVLDLEATVLWHAGKYAEAAALRRVSKAIKGAMNQGVPVAESIALGWTSNVAIEGPEQEQLANGPARMEGSTQ